MKISVEERRWILVFSGLVLGITSLPYLLAYSHSINPWQFTGFLIGVDDGNSYIAKMLAGSSGAWLFRSPYTAYPQKGMLAFLPYLLLGKLAAGAGMHEQLVALFQAFRWVAGCLDIISTYIFISTFITDIHLRKLATAVTCLGGGLGWLLLVTGHNSWLGSLPLDFYSPETFGFLEIYALPHLAAARAGLFFALTLYITWLTDPLSHRKLPLLCGSALLLTGLFQPLTALIGWVVIGAHQLVLFFYGVTRIKRSLLQHLNEYSDLLWVYLISCPIILYTGYSSLTDPYMQAWTAQNIIRSPNPLHYVIAFLLVFPLAVLGIARMIRSDLIRGSILAAWGLLFPFLAYFPYNLQRRLPEGIWVVWVVGAVILLQASRRKIQRFLKVPLILTVFSPLILFIGSITTYMQPVQPVFLHAGEVRAFDFLASQDKERVVVLAAYDTGNALPAWAPDYVLIGHGPESIHFDDIKNEVAAFFSSGENDSNRMDLINRFNIRYVFYGPAEKSLGTWDPQTAPFLTAVYNQEGYTIYRVTR